MTDIKSRELLNTFFKSGVRVQYKKGETIVRPEDDPSGVFLIEWGFVKAYIITKYGEENLLHIRSTSSVFPHIWAFTGQHRQVVYEAMEPTSMWRIGRLDYLNFLEKNPSIMPVILDMTIESYRLNSERVMTLSYRTTRERIISFIVNSARRFGVENKNGTITIHAPLRQSDIAGSVNATRETTSREINSLKKKGILSMKDHKIVIHDLEYLESVL